MSKPVECSSCKNGGSEFPDFATFKVIKAPMDARKLHGSSLCESHADILLDDYPEAEIKEIPEWIEAIKNHKEGK